MRTVVSWPNQKQWSMGNDATSHHLTSFNYGERTAINRLDYVGSNYQKKFETAQSTLVISNIKRDPI